MWNNLKSDLTQDTKIGSEGYERLGTTMVNKAIDKIGSAAFEDDPSDSDAETEKDDLKFLKEQKGCIKIQNDIYSFAFAAFLDPERLDTSDEGKKAGML